MNMKLTEYIKKNFDNNQAEFARHMNVPRQKITKWINADWIVVDDTLYSPRRDINNKDIIS